MPLFKPVPAGSTFGRLTVLKDRAQGEKTVSCVCLCGTEKLVKVYHLLSGHTVSCGCAQREAVNSLNTTHGKTNSRAYIAFRNMHQRCYNPNRKQWKDWGGRGITVCDEWHEFSNFYADMGDPPEGMMLDRIDNDAGYSPENCRWTTRLVQNQNRRPEHTPPVEGWTKPGAQLTPDQIIEIRTRYAAGGVKQRDLGAEYGVAQPQISRIVRGGRWADITQDTPADNPSDAESE